MNWWLMIIIPLTSAFIGWVTNRQFIRMLFHPVKPVHFLGFTIQGIFPKRQSQFAQKLGALVSNELLSFTDIEAKITNEENVKKIMPVAEKHIDEFLRHKLGEAFPMIGMFIGEKTIGTLKSIFMKELETIFPIIMKEYVQNLQKDLDLEQMVTGKIAAVSTEKLEANLYQALSKELRLAGLFCGAVGFLVGLVQVLIIMVLI
ncbi:DUF445 family protein [Niastella caeni]|uniref:DUF445 family protein n=1 Tax=Niastella caeni TaxID=2569763 RepID=A0A4V4GZF6_9BACT|nr:DUF445 family protein [Niastella caeni]THU32506.1 DUF445 family protein [Niastella caeni]